MKILDQSTHAGSPISYAGIVERTEILSSTLRWSTKLERPEIERLLRQSSALRDEVMRMSFKERFVTAAAAEPTRADRSPGERLQALLERSFVFEGTFGDNPKLLEALEIAEKAAPTDLPVLRRRERNRQGADGEGHPCERDEGRQVLHFGQLRSDPGQPAGVRALRAQERRVHRCLSRSQGQVRERSQGNHFSRRDRRAAVVGTGKAS